MMSLYHSINYLLVLAMLVSPYIPNSPKVVITAGIVAAGTTSFNSILLTRYFSNCYNCNSNCVTQYSSNTFTV